MDPPPFRLLSPLANWSGGEVELAPGLGIRRSNPEPGYSLCYQFDNPYPEELARHRKCREDAFRRLLHAAYAVQVLVPCGWSGEFRLDRREADGWRQEAVERRQPLLETVWGRRSVVPAPLASDAPALLERVVEAFLKPVLRLQIVIWMLEQGMAAPDQHIRILLCVTGLDGLTRSSGQANFSERLGSLLGADTLLFPPDEAGRQPRYRVGEVTGHLYQLRNELAHGLPFQAIFHKKTGFLDVEGKPISPEFARYRYDRVLEECAVFLFSRALREVLLSRLIFDIHTLEWRTTG